MEEKKKYIEMRDTAHVVRYAGQSSQFQGRSALVTLA